MDQVVFYFDFSSPDAYLIAERITSELPVIAEWQPVNSKALDNRLIGDEWEEINRKRIEELASQQGLQPFRWPEVPPDTELALKAATFAKKIGRVTAFSLAAFRQAYAGGRDLSQLDSVLIAAAACELHPAALRKAVELRSTETHLQQATSTARSLGIQRVPVIRVGEEIFAGDDLLERAFNAIK